MSCDSLIYLCVVFRENRAPVVLFKDFNGGHEAAVRPVPIPNTAVKRSVADGSGFIDSARVGSRHFLVIEQTSYDLFPFSHFTQPVRSPSQLHYFTFESRHIGVFRESLGPPQPRC